MKSLFVWIGVLVGSVALGVGLYGLVVRPADAAGLSVSSAAQPSPTPTIYRYKTKVVKDPPKRVVVDVPAPAAPSATSEPTSARTGDDGQTQLRHRESARDEGSDDRADDQGEERRANEHGDED